eukprot:NODE_8404_length_1498_cov_3.858497.p1 GENE.NODE_8404_length_1498_cov_3.858497~~NODE_8404_length_1498_cov_3.858497.p1  ORF type:complete len:174 (+),score=17.10 NODE_8404_length_1498_cov_3.858497:708-1229(+)
MLPFGGMKRPSRLEGVPGHGPAGSAAARLGSTAPRTPPRTPLHCQHSPIRRTGCGTTACHDMCTQHISIQAWSVAPLEYTDTPVWSAIAAAWRLDIPHFVSISRGNFVWAVSVLPIVDLPLRYALAAAAIPLIHDCEPPRLSCTAWAVADRGFLVLPLMAAISSQSLRLITVL